MTIHERIREVKIKREARIRAERYGSLLEKFIVLWGTKGQGKTSSGVHFAHNFREATGREVVVVGTLIGLTDQFGPSRFLSSQEFICQMRLISKVAPTLTPEMTDDDIELELLNARGCTDKQHDPEYVLLANGQWKHEDQCSEKALENSSERGAPCWTSQNGVILYRSIVILDEGNEFTGGDTASNPVVRLFGRTIQQMRHLRVTLIEMAPGPEDIAPKIRKQVDTFGRCFTFKDLGYTKVVFSGGVLMEQWSTQFPSQKYWNMYTSFNILAIRERNLAIADKYI